MNKLNQRLIPPFNTPESQVLANLMRGKTIPVDDDKGTPRLRTAKWIDDLRESNWPIQIESERTVIRGKTYTRKVYKLSCCCRLDDREKAFLRIFKAEEALARARVKYDELVLFAD